MSQTRQRRNRVEFCLNDTELERLNALTQKSGRSKSSWLRAVIMGYRLCEKPDSAFYDAMKELTRFGNNLNQLTAKAHSLGFVDAPALEREIQQWQKFRMDIFQTYLQPRKEQCNGGV